MIDDSSLRGGLHEIDCNESFSALFFKQRRRHHQHRHQLQNQEKPIHQFRRKSIVIAKRIALGFLRLGK